MMKIEYNERFLKDLKKLKKVPIYQQLKVYCFEELSTCESLSSIQGLKKIQGYKYYYRIRFGDYRAGGCGGTCDGVCGGLSGGIMVMSSCFGRSRAGFGTENDEKQCSSRMAKALYQKFVDTYGSAICKEIHGEIFGRTFDFWNAEDKQAFEDAGAHTEKCPSVVANASRWTMELILEELEQRGIDLKDFTL